MEILRVEKLSKIYSDKQSPVKALNNISFSVNKGEFVAIIGPSGSGKSTLLHMIGGIDFPTSGKVIVNGINIHKLSEEKLAIFRRRQIGLIYQFFNLIPVLSAKENINLPILLDANEVNEEKTKELLRLLSLEDRAHFLPNQLSGGQQQRVSIARALITTPAIILADEPTGNLDSKNSKEVIDLLKMSHKINKQTLILITHDESIALQADRILAIEDGSIVKDTRLFHE